jgi:hypothetical protein
MSWQGIVDIAQWLSIISLNIIVISLIRKEK